MVEFKDGGQPTVASAASPTPGHGRAVSTGMKYQSFQVGIDDVLAFANECSQPGGGRVVRFTLNAARPLQSYLLELYINLDLDLNPLEATEQANSKFVRASSRSALDFPSTRKPDPTGGALVKTSPIVVVIDDGCSFANSRLVASNGGALVSAIWDQDPDANQQGLDRTRADPAGISRRTPANEANGIGYGQKIIIGAAYSSIRGSSKERSESEVYISSGYLYPTPAWTHGSAILDVVGSSRTLGPPAHDWLRGLHAADEVIFIQLPVATVDDTSGGSLTGYALDGIHEALASAGSRPVIVNLSYGTHSGPHDGTSMFESALDELLTKNVNLHVVLPAGNSHLSRCHWYGYVEQQVPKVLRWKVIPDNPTDSFMELWFEDDADIEVRLIPPDASGSPPIRPESAWSLSSHGDRTPPVVSAAVIYPGKAAEGKRGRMVLLAVAATRRRIVRNRRDDDSGAPEVHRQAPHGIWRIELVNRGSVRKQVHAWIQRDDRAPGRSRSRLASPDRQSYFVEDDLTRAAPEFTLNGIATLAPKGNYMGRLWVVGAMRRSDQSLSLYSAAGPNRNTGDRTEGPDVVTVADHSICLPGTLVSTALSGGTRRVDGTSIAAAVFTRILNDHLCKSPSWPLVPFPPDPLASRNYVDRPRRVEGDPDRAQPFLRGLFQRLNP